MARKIVDHYKKYGKKWYELHKETELLRSKEYYINFGKEKKKEKYPNRRSTILKSRYGITEADFNILYEKQKGKCAICGIHYHLTLHIDHCHATGKVRGLLCNNCNRGLGHFKDSADNLKSAAEYLLQHDITGGGTCGS